MKSRLALCGFLLFNFVGIASAQLPPPPADFDKYDQNIAHGKLQVVQYYSSTIGVNRNVKIYTPPGYSTSKNYNVLYLLHGIGGDINEWTYYSKPENILDNLYAQGKLEPMIVVFPNGRAKVSDSPGSNMYSDENVAAFAKFEFELINDLVPFMEKNYPLYKNRLNRALGGYSMGGGQAYNFGLGHLDTFAWIGAIAGAPNTKSAAELIPDPAIANERIKLLFMTCGDADGLFSSNNALHENFTQRNISHLWQVEPGIGHETTMWQRALYNFAPRLFKGIYSSCANTDCNANQSLSSTVSSNAASSAMSSTATSATQSSSKAETPPGKKSSGSGAIGFLDMTFYLLLIGSARLVSRRNKLEKK